MGFKRVHLGRQQPAGGHERGEEAESVRAGRGRGGARREERGWAVDTLGVTKKVEAFYPIPGFAFCCGSCSLCPPACRWRNALPLSSAAWDPEPSAAELKPEHRCRACSRVRPLWFLPWLHVLAQRVLIARSLSGTESCDP